MKKRPAARLPARAINIGAAARPDDQALDVPGLEDQLRQCLAGMRRNQMLFDLETEPELIDALVYEYQAIQSRYRYLQRRARAEGLRAIL